jgi:hypothetical protein
MLHLISARPPARQAGAAAPASRHLLDALTRAYAAGDAVLGEYLLGQALDEGLPWDQVCAAAARGSARRASEGSRD